jgi:hypothetical protein
MTRRDDPDGVLAWMEEKAAQVTGLPVYHGEVPKNPTITLLERLLLKSICTPCLWEQSQEERVRSARMSRALLEHLLPEVAFFAYAPVRVST